MTTPPGPRTPPSRRWRGTTRSGSAGSATPCASGSWSWSDTFYRILGFEPGQVVPSAAVLAAHLRPDGDAAGSRRRGARPSDRRAVQLHTRMVDAHGSERMVLLAGHGERQEGAVRTGVGYLVDLTESAGEASRVDVQEALAGALDHRAVIEQAKGVLMLAQGVDADEAFMLLRAHSQDSNIKVRDLAERLVRAGRRGRRAGRGLPGQVLRIFGASARDAAPARAAERPAGPGGLRRGAPGKGSCVNPP